MTNTLPESFEEKIKRESDRMYGGLFEATQYERDAFIEGGKYAKQILSPPVAVPDEKGIHIWDAIDGEFYEVDNLKDAEKWIKEGYCDPEDGIHPDIESIEIFKKIAGVEVVPVPGKDTFKIEIKALASTQPSKDWSEIEKRVREKFEIGERGRTFKVPIDELMEFLKDNLPTR